MIILVLIITGILCLVLIVPVVCSVDDLDTDGIKYLLVTLSVLVSVFLGTVGVYGTAYATSGENIAELKSQYNNNLNNLRTIALSLNRQVIVTTNNEKLLIDVANLKQSTKTSDVFLSYVQQVNQYNTELELQKVRRTPGFFFKMWYGWKMPLTAELKTVTIKF